MSADNTLLKIMSHLGAAKIQRAPSDDKIIAEHIDEALEIARRLRYELKAERADMLAALQKFTSHYPHGINPGLDEAYSMARDAMSQEP